MSYEVGKVSGVTPARRKYYERSMVHVGFSSLSTCTDSVVWGAGGATNKGDLFMPPTSVHLPIINYSTRLDWLHMYFNPNVDASSFYLKYYNIDSTLETHYMTISTAVTLANNGYNWVVPLPGRTAVSPLCNATSTGHFMFICAESFGDQIFGNK